MQNGLEKESYVIVRNFDSDAATPTGSPAVQGTQSQRESEQTVAVCQQKEGQPPASPDANGSREHDKGAGGTSSSESAAYVQNSLTTLAAVACSVTQPEGTSTHTTSLQSQRAGSAVQVAVPGSHAKVELHKITAGECISGALGAILGDTAASVKNRITEPNQQQGDIAALGPVSNPEGDEIAELTAEAPPLDKPVDLHESQEAYGYERATSGNLARPGMSSLCHLLK